MRTASRIIALSSILLVASFGFAGEPTKHCKTDQKAACCATASDCCADQATCCKHHCGNDCAKKCDNACTKHCCKKDKPA